MPQISLVKGVWCPGLRWADSGSAPTLSTKQGVTDSKWWCLYGRSVLCLSMQCLVLALLVNAPSGLSVCKEPQDLGVKLRVSDSQFINI